MPDVQKPQSKKNAEKPLKKLRIIELDPYLAPYEAKLNERLSRFKALKKRLAGGKKLADFANGALYYGFHKAKGGHIYREWAPAADALHLIGDFNGWDRAKHPLKKLDNGNWEVFIEEDLPHASRVKVQVTANGKTFDKLPLYIRRVVQNDDMSFSGQIWEPETPYEWQIPDYSRPKDEPLLIYECHVGMGGEAERVSTYDEFRQNVLPRVKAAGYNAIQVMALMEHPYYASFGYQVTNFFAVSSRFGTPEELKALIDEAHTLGIAVLLDIIHSHASGNELEGINRFDGTEYQFFHAGGKGDHPAWGTKLFDYGKPEVLHFLLSNIKFYLEEYKLDGFRFDGVTSMLYLHHGLGEAFDSYAKYFSSSTDEDAVAYLQLASELAREVKPGALMIAEDMSGMPGMCLPQGDGGIGFDYRLAMGVPDFWIRTLKTLPDEKWDLWQLWHELTTRRPGEKNVGYCESHDQALVGDKTIMFWLADKEMYWNMHVGSKNEAITRAIALHKLIRLVTFALSGEGYLNFMGNEFGHPEWIDFPREGNGWSYAHARRQWSLADDEGLQFKYLGRFDRDMLALAKNGRLLDAADTKLLTIDQERKRLAFSRGDYYFAFNFHPTDDQSVDFSVPPGRYGVALSSDDALYGGSKADAATEAEMAKKGKSDHYIGTFLPKRSAVVFRAK